jgi:hypothetical protein
MSVFLPECCSFPGHRREAAEHIPICVPNEFQSVRTAVAAEVKFPTDHTVATASPQRIDTLLVDLFEERWELRDDQGIEAVRRRRGSQSSGDCQPEQFCEVFRKGSDRCSAPKFPLEAAEKEWMSKCNQKSL